MADTNESLSDQTCTNQAIQGTKMKIESEVGTSIFYELIYCFD